MWTLEDEVFQTRHVDIGGTPEELPWCLGRGTDFVVVSLETMVTVSYGRNGFPLGCQTKNVETNKTLGKWKEDR